MENLDGVVVSTRIRFARNLVDYPFPHRLKSKESAREIIDLLKIPLEQIDDFRLCYMDTMSESERELLQANYLISGKLIANKEISALFLSPDETVSVMINEEDHLREQYWTTGFHLLKAYEYLSGLDDMIGECVKFAFDPRLGYLTACPTNLGTGMRASVMMFLPATTRQGMMADIVKRVQSIGLTIRGAYGEGSAAEGYMYQLSNEVTLGVDEETILDAVKTQVVKIAEVEIRAREEEYKRDPVGIADACGRAYGILTHCERLSYSEFLRLLADLKTGAYLGLYDTEQIADVNELVLAMRDSNINRYFEKPLGGRKLAEERAKAVRKRIRAWIGEKKETL